LDDGRCALEAAVGREVVADHLLADQGLGLVLWIQRPVDLDRLDGLSDDRVLVVGFLEPADIE